MSLTPMAAYQNRVQQYMAPAYVVVSRPTAQELADATDETVDFTSSATVEADSADGMFVSTDSAKITIKRSGVYIATANAAFAADADGYRTLWILNDASVVARERQAGYNVLQYLSCSGLFYAETGAVILTKVRQSGGAALDLDSIMVGVVMLK